MAHAGSLFGAPLFQTPNFSDPRTCTTIILTWSDLEDRIKAPPDPCIIQRFIKAKGVKPSMYAAHACPLPHPSPMHVLGQHLTCGLSPCRYRTVWRPGKALFALNLVNEESFMPSMRAAGAGAILAHASSGDGGGGGSGSGAGGGTKGKATESTGAGEGADGGDGGKTPGAVRSALHLTANINVRYTG